MKRKLLGLLVLFALGAGWILATPLVSYLQEQASTNPSYEILKLQQGIDSMEFERSQIEATSHGEELKARMTYVSAQLSWQQAVQGFFSDILGSLLDVLTTGIDETIAKINLEDASRTHADNQVLFNKKLLSETELKSSGLERDEARVNLESVTRDRSTATRSFQDISSLNPDQIDLPFPAPSGFFLSDAEFSSQNLSFQSARLALENAQNEMQNLSSWASPFEKKQVELSLKKQQLSTTAVESSMVDEHTRLKNSILGLYTSARVSSSRWELESGKLDDVHQRYQKGLVSEKDLWSQQKTTLSAQKTYLSSMRQYLQELINYLVQTGRDPLEVLR